MRYSFEYKMECIEIYRRGEWPNTPEGVKKTTFREAVQIWERMEAIHGPEILKRKRNRRWKPEEKMCAINKTIAGQSIRMVAATYGIDPSVLRGWIKRYKLYGMDGLTTHGKIRPSREYKMDSKQSEPLNESEREELFRLREETEYLRTELAYVKKLRALRLEKEAAQLKAKKQKQSKNSEKEDSN